MSNYFIVKAVTPYELNGEKKEHWTKIGVLFAHKSGNGFDLKLDFIPTNPATKLVALTPTSSDKESEK